MPPDRLATLFCEDVGHEEFIRALVHRIATEEEISVDVQSVTTRGGHWRALSEFVLFQRVLQKESRSGDLLVVAIDANCRGANLVRGEISGLIHPGLFRAHAIACPDPHIERWYLADPLSLESVLDVVVRPPKAKCERAAYKKVLAQSFRRAGYVLTLGGAEFARDVVAVMNLFRACKAEASLKIFVDALRSAFRIT